MANDMRNPNDRETNTRLRTILILAVIAAVAVAAYAAFRNDADNGLYAERSTTDRAMNSAPNQ